jgi:hypothetical protein
MGYLLAAAQRYKNCIFSSAPSASLRWASP